MAEQYLFRSANAERLERGLRPLRWDDGLWRAATEHAQAMADRASISHRYPGEAELAVRGREAGARFSHIAENVAEASSAVVIHSAWMNSEDHRANLLDPDVDAVGISVLQRGGQLFAVEDFDHTVQTLSLGEQERTVAELVRSAADVQLEEGTQAARQTCQMDTGFAGTRRPWFVMRFTAGELTRLPDELRRKLSSGLYRQAAVGACSPDPDDEPFSAFRLVVLLYR